MTIGQYRKLGRKGLEGRKVRLTRDIESGAVKISKGTVLVIASVGPWLRLEGPKCHWCGVTPYMTQVKPDAVELI